MEEVLKQLNELCRDTLVDNLGMVFTAAGEGWLEARMPIDRRTCRPDGALHGVLIWLLARRSEEL